MSQDIYVVVEHLRGQVADISYVMLAAARVLAKGTGGSVVGMLLGYNVRELANDLAADRVLYVDHPALADFTAEAYQTVLADLIGTQPPRAVLLGHTSIGMDIASGLSARLAFPQVSQCRTVGADDGTLKFASQICGGKLMVEGELPGPTVLVTMLPGGFRAEQGRTTTSPEVTQVTAAALDRPCVTLKQYIEPEAGDVDITQAPVLIAVGRGIEREDNLELAEELADAMGAVVCGSRPVVDQGWLPTPRLVGKSGKTVKPTVYLALGISGAPEHVEGMGESEVILAVNTDPAAPIFNVAKYGAEIDLLDLLPELTERVKQAQEVKGHVV